MIHIGVNSKGNVSIFGQTGFIAQFCTGLKLFVRLGLGATKIDAVIQLVVHHCAFCHELVVIGLYHLLHFSQAFIVLSATIPFPCLLPRIELLVVFEAFNLGGIDDIQISIMVMLKLFLQSLFQR